MELEFENKYKEIYKLRYELISGNAVPDKDVIAEFDKTAEELKDDDYEKIEVVPCDVKGIQNTPKGVSDFWLKSMLNHPIGGNIEEKDRAILGYLSNIELDLHSKE